MEHYLKVLFIGDIVGQPGIEALEKYLTRFKEMYTPDFIIMNGENVAAGRGISEKEANRLFELGSNVITTGNHVWENWKAKALLATNANVLRPFNYPSGNAGRGYVVAPCNGFNIAVLNIQGRTFMQAIDCPFKAMDYILSTIVERTKVIIVDFHADATAEKIAMGHYLDGRVSAVLGTHTHIQTSDARIQPLGTAYITDVGMTGPYDSVVGMKKEIAVRRFTLQTPFKYELATDDVRISGVFIKIDATTGKAVEIEPIFYPDWSKTSVITSIVNSVDNSLINEEIAN